MLSVTFQPLTTFTDGLLSAIADFLRPVIIQFFPGQLGSVAALQLELTLVPLRIIAAATIGAESVAYPPPQIAESIAIEQTESVARIATVNWLKLDEPTPETEPVPNIIDMVKARQQRELPPAMPDEVPADALIVMGADGRFSVSEIDDGYLVRRWVQLKKGPHLSQHVIPTAGRCDCRQSELGVICCHHKALKSHIEKQHIEGKVSAWKEQERAQRLEALCYQVIVWRDGHDGAEIFWEGADIDNAEFKFKIACQHPPTNTTKIYDRRQDANLKMWHRPSPAQVEDARQALGFAAPKPTGDWQSRQELEDSIVAAAAKLGWLLT